MYTRSVFLLRYNTTYGLLPLRTQQHRCRGQASKEFEKLIAEDERTASLKNTALVQELREQVHGISRKLDRLTDLYIAQDIERDDYLARRRSLVLEKKSVEEQSALLERDAGHWLEPMRAWVNDASLLDEAAISEDIPSKKSTLQKIFGSNLQLHNKKVRETAPPPWAALRAARRKFRASDASFIRAAGLGFEPRLPDSESGCLPLADPAKCAASGAAHLYYPSLTLFSILLVRLIGSSRHPRSHPPMRWSNRQHLSRRARRP